MKFDVYVTRKYYATAHTQIEADTWEEAERMANELDTAELDFGGINGSDIDEVEVYKAIE